MPSNAKAKKTGGNKDAATKHAMNPPAQGGKQPGNQTHEPEELDPERQFGQFGETGQPPLMKK